MAKAAGSSGQTAKPRGRPFQKGQSGNPSGRKPIPQDVKDMLKAATKDAAKLLIDTMKNDSEKIDMRIKCAETILDRVYGKATQPIESDSTVKVILEGLEDFAK